MDHYRTRVDEESEIVFRGNPLLLGKSGFQLIENFFEYSTEPLKKLSEKIKNDREMFGVNEPGSNLVRSKLNVHPKFDAFLHDQKLLEKIHSIMPGAKYIHQSRINYKQGSESTGWHWHSDFETWHYQDGMPTPKCFTVMIPLDENTEENGCLQIIPGSHQYYIRTKKGTDSSAYDNFANQVDGVPEQEDIEKIGGKIVSITCKPGDLLIFDSNLLHRSLQNKTIESRTNLYFVINSIDNLLIPMKNPRPEEMGHRKYLRFL